MSFKKARNKNAKDIWSKNKVKKVFLYSQTKKQMLFFWFQFLSQLLVEKMGGGLFLMALFCLFAFLQHNFKVRK